MTPQKCSTPKSTIISSTYLNLIGFVIMSCNINKIEISQSNYNTIFNSIVSTQEECCAAAANHPGLLQAAVKALQKHREHPAIVVRLAYALGNMMANSDDARWEVRFIDLNEVLK